MLQEQINTSPAHFHIPVVHSGYDIIGMNRQMATPAPCSEERTNFFRVCRVVLDHIPEVLRAIFKDRVQRRHKHAWDDTSDSGTKWLYAQYPRVFSSLYTDQENLLKGGQTEKWDPTLLVHVLKSSALCLLLDEIPGATVSVQQNVTVVSVPSGSQVPAGASAGRRICIDNGKKCVHGEVASVSPGQIVLTQTAKIKPSGAKVYVCTPEFEAVDRLRGIRNACFGHMASATTPEVELDNVLTRVEQAYIELHCSEAVESLVEIKTEAILDEDTREDYQRRLDEFYKQSQDYEQRFEGIEKSVDELELKQEATGQQVESNTQAIDVLKEKVETLSQQVQGNNDVAPGNQLASALSPDQPPIPMLDTAVMQSRGGGNGSGSPPSHLSLDTAMMTSATPTRPAVVSHHTIPDPPAPHGLDPTEPQDSADGSPHDPGLDASPNTQPLQLPRPQYYYVEDHSRGQSRFKCALKVNMDGCPKTISGGYHATRPSATQEAERKLTARTFLEGLQSKGFAGKHDYKYELEKYFKLLKGLAQPRILYRTRECRGYQSTVTAPGKGSVTGEVCKTRPAAEQSAALQMLQMILKYADD